LWKPSQIVSAHVSYILRDLRGIDKACERDKSTFTALAIALFSFKKSLLNRQQNARADNSDDKTENIEMCLPVYMRNQSPQKPANDGTDNSDNDVGDATLFLIGAHNHRGNPTSQRAQNDPANNTHAYLLKMKFDF
jgi:hypothetical protein